MLSESVVSSEQHQHQRRHQQPEVHQLRPGKHLWSANSPITPTLLHQTSMRTPRLFFNLTTVNSSNVDEYASTQICHPRCNLHERHDPGSNQFGSSRPGDEYPKGRGLQMRHREQGYSSAAGAIVTSTPPKTQRARRPDLKTRVHSPPPHLPDFIPLRAPVF
jgi:hypothetical protein